MSVFKTVKEALSTRQVAEYYGIKVNRYGMCRCPFHDDRSPSMKVDKNFICFGCQEKGDVIRFASLLFSLPPFEAARKLVEDMGLVVAAGDLPAVRSGMARHARRKARKTEQFEETVDRVYWTYCDYLHLLNEWAEEYAPRSPDEEFHPLFVEAMHKRDYAEYLLDLLFYGSEKDKAAIVIDKGKGVRELERRLEKYQSGKGERASLHDSDAYSGEDDGRSNGDVGSDGQGAGQKQCDERGTDPVL